MSAVLGESLMKRQCCFLGSSKLVQSQKLGKVALRKNQFILRCSTVTLDSTVTSCHDLTEVHRVELIY